MCSQIPFSPYRWKSVMLQMFFFFSVTLHLSTHQYPVNELHNQLIKGYTGAINQILMWSYNSVVYSKKAISSQFPSYNNRCGYGRVYLVTVNQLIFAAVKFRGLPIFFYFAHFNFAFLHILISWIFQNREIREIKSHAKFSWFTVLIRCPQDDHAKKKDVQF